MSKTFLKLLINQIYKITIKLELKNARNLLKC